MSFAPARAVWPAPALAVPWWALPAALLLAGLAAALPLPMAAALPIVACLGLLGFLRPLVALLALVLVIPISSLLALDLGPLSVSMAEPGVALLGAGWLAAALARRTLRLEGGPLLAPVLVLGAVMLASATWAEEFAPAIGEVIKWAELIVVFLFVCTWLRRRSQVFAVLATLFVAGLAEALVGLFQFATGTGPTFFAVGDFLRAYGTFGQPNPFAGYLATSVPFALTLLALPRGQAPRWLRGLALLAALLFGAAIVTSLSRGTWLALGLALGVMLLAWERRSRRYLAPALGLALVFGLLAALGLLPQVITERLGVLLDYFGVFDVRTVEVNAENFAVVERMAHWQSGWYMFLDHPVFGVGIGNYPAAYVHYYLPGWPEPLGHAHNYYLNTAAEVGLIGLVALLWLLAAAYALLVGGLRLARAPLDRALLAAGLGSLVVFCVFNAFDNLLVHGVTMQLGLLLGLAYVARRGVQDA